VPLPPPLRLLEGERERALVVDDQQTGRLLLGELLRHVNPNIEVVDFEEASSALEWAENEVADLVLMDYRLPGTDGIEAVRILRRRAEYDGVPIVMITVVDDPGVKKAALDAGVTDFLSRPMDIHEAFARCRNLLRLRRYSKARRDDDERH
jgi:two-component system, response regulator RpfG